MTSFTHHFPGLADDPLTQIRDLPDQPFRIAPLRDPKPQRALTIPHPLEPNAGSSREGHNSTAKLSSRNNTTKPSTSAETAPREKTVKPTDISSLVEPVAKPPKVQLPSFVSLAAVENRPPPVVHEDSRKRARVDFDDLLVAEPILLPKLPDFDKKPASTQAPSTSVSALHEPPPNGDLLPPIDVDSILNRSVDAQNNGRATEIDTRLGFDQARSATDSDISSISIPNGVEGAVKKSRRQVRKWTSEETAELMEGVRTHGIGKWKDILEDPKCTLGKFRTAIDLKDRFRVCCPESYKARPGSLDTSPESPQDPSTVKNGESSRMKLADVLTPHVSDPEPSSQPESSTRKSGNSRSERLSDEARERLGIAEAIERDQSNPSGRRRRRLWTRDEDSNLMRGVEKHGFAWTSMQEDETLNLGHRKATDLRDRIRNKFPDGYKQAGFRPVRSKHITMSNTPTPTSGTFSQFEGATPESQVGTPSASDRATTDMLATSVVPRGPPSPPILRSSGVQGQLPSDNHRTVTTESIMAMDSLLTDQTDAQDENPKTLTLPGFTMFRDDWERDDDPKADGRNDDFEWSTTLPPLEEYFPL